MDPIIKLEGIWKLFGKVIALEAISLQLYPGEVHCLLGDNGAGKSTLIKILSGVHSQTRGRFLFEGKTIVLNSPRQALDLGIATVFQDLAMLSVMSVTRNFFLGREPKKSLGPIQIFDFECAAIITTEELRLCTLAVELPDVAPVDD
jgi:simple sugar transport system ATP-binding protein